jgi:hypothetical protein
MPVRRRFRRVTVSGSSKSVLNDLCSGRLLGLHKCRRRRDFGRAALHFDAIVP